MRTEFVLLAKKSANALSGHEKAFGRHPGNGPLMHPTTLQNRRPATLGHVARTWQRACPGAANAICSHQKACGRHIPISATRPTWPRKGAENATLAARCHTLYMYSETGAWFCGHLTVLAKRRGCPAIPAEQPLNVATRRGRPGSNVHGDYRRSLWPAQDSEAHSSAGSAGHVQDQ